MTGAAVSTTSSGADVAGELAEWGAGLPFNRLLGVQVRRVETGRVEVVLPYDERLCNHVGGTHAVAEVAPAELAGAVAATSRLAPLLEAGLVPVLKNLAVRYRRPVTGELVAVAEVSEADAAPALAAHAAGQRARMEVNVRLESDGEHVGDVLLEFVYVPAAR